MQLPKSIFIWNKKVDQGKNREKLISWDPLYDDNYHNHPHEPISLDSLMDAVLSSAQLWHTDTLQSDNTIPPLW
jgi:hypothetical protein